ncbi:tetratricopeptide repeat protein [Hymenobacter metallilatus]|uniref:Uncharacterized protein n=1 Tax=Hymenobacter metallilatus TaxID=2493666 RepID=A0A428JNF0_9BACT|nr:hypothetical protein [Hymenobacter metallilatus]RSK34650.1 hypothetical protein EI290_08500 [Hymenobacter metallilatus]
MLLLSTWGGFTRIHERNATVERGTRAYAGQQYPEAAAAFKQATRSLSAPDEAIWLNLAHATLRAGRPAEARGYYSQLSTSKLTTMRSVAFQQLSYIAAQKADYVQALSLARQALLANPDNADARYNYELLRELLNQQSARPQLPPPGPAGGPGNENTPSQTPQTRAGTTTPGQLNNQVQDPRSAPQARPDAGGQRNPNEPSGQPGLSAPSGFQPGTGPKQQVAQGSQPGSVRGMGIEEGGPEASGGRQRGGTEVASNAEANLQTQRARLLQMNLSPGQARQLLEALHATEQQYLQQLPRKATKPAPKGRPGW